MAVLILAGCGDNGSGDLTAKTKAALNDRGLISKQIGEEFFTFDQDEKRLITMTVDEIVPDIPCTQDYAQAPEQAHFIGIRMTIVTEPGYDAIRGPFYGISPKEFEIVGPDGQVDTALNTGSGHVCLPESERAPLGPLAPASSYKGVVVLDSRYASGTIGFRIPVANIGWQWSF